MCRDIVEPLLSPGIDSPWSGVPARGPGPVGTKRYLNEAEQANPTLVGERNSVASP